MGYALAVAPCANCKKVFSYMEENADYLLSVPTLPETGLPPDIQLVDGKVAPRECTEEEIVWAWENKRPLCLNCAEILLKNMRAKGVEPPEIIRRAYEVPA